MSDMATDRTPVKSVVKNVPDVKYCRVCGESIAAHSGYFNIFSEKSKERHIAEFLSKVLESEVSDVTGYHFICKKCFRAVERCHASLEVLKTLKENHRASTEKWRSENPDLIRQKRCSKSPSEGMKKSRLDINLFLDSGKTGAINVNEEPLAPRVVKRSLLFGSSDKEKQSMSVESRKDKKVEVNKVKNVFVHMR